MQKIVSLCFRRLLLPAGTDFRVWFARKVCECARRLDFDEAQRLAKFASPIRFYKLNDDILLHVEPWTRRKRYSEKYFRLRHLRHGWSWSIQLSGSVEWVPENGLLN